MTRQPPTAGSEREKTASDQSDDVPDTRALLVSDIDDTLTGDDEALDALVQAVNAKDSRVSLAVNSSRPAGSVDRTLREVFPEAFRPIGMITAMGTEVRVRGTLIDAWQARFAGWPRKRIDEVVRSFGHRPHDAEMQTEFKASYAVPTGDAQAEVAEALKAAGLPCRIIASGVDDMDILPPGAGKDHATLFLTELLGFVRSQLIVAGDSGNDLAMFQVAPRAIAVGNARRELIDAAPADRVYHARAPYAAGVHEGLIHYGILPEQNKRTTD
jgi:sucrose-6F-phosphate phosphohydrolase